MTEADKEQQLQNWFAEMYNLLMFLKVFCIGSPLFFILVELLVTIIMQMVIQA
jgi:hypothetical protein